MEDGPYGPPVREAAEHPWASSGAKARMFFEPGCTRGCHLPRSPRIPQEAPPKGSNGQPRRGDFVDGALPSGSWPSTRERGRRRAHTELHKERIPHSGGPWLDRTKAPTRQHG
jgi:hypothetical protein